MVIVGSVSKGIGGASADVRDGAYSPELLGFHPAIGTLNVNVDASVVPGLLELGEHVRIIWRAQPLLLWKARIFEIEGTDVDIKCWLMWPKRPSSMSVLETLAPVHLRTAYGLTDGSTLRYVVAVD